MTGPNDPNEPNGPYDPNQSGQPQYPSEQYPPQQYPPQQYPEQQYPPQQYPPASPEQAAYGQQPYPGQPYPGQPYPGQPQPPTQRLGLLERVGPRALQRPEPRLGVTLGGVGVGLVVAGVLIWSFTYLIEGLVRDIRSSSGGVDDSRRFLGAVLGLVVVVAGYVLVVRARAGALRTAGVVATALGVPVTMEFLTLSFGSGSPINLDAVFWVSVLAYLISYFFVPGARGHSFYLGLALLQVWSYIVDKVDSSALTSVTTSGLRAVPGIGAGSSDVPTPDVGATSIGVTSLVIGLIYYAAAYLLDRRGRHGIAVPLLVAGAPVVVIGLSALAGDLSQLGTGIVAILLGLALSAYGAGFRRRFTTWFWAVVAAVGAILVVTKVATSGTSIGITLVVVGAVVVLAGRQLGTVLNETPDIDEGVAVPAVAPPRKH